MFPRAKHIRVIKDFDVEVTFKNGERHTIPLKDEIVARSSEMTKPLKDPAYFAKVFVNPECGNNEWPNGYDVDPDVLYWLATGKPIEFSADEKYHHPPSHLRKARRRGARSVKKSTKV